MASASVALAVIAAAVTLRIVVRAHSPVLFGDQWELINTLVRSHGHPSLHDFWAQHNEHRIVTGRLFGFADLYLFGGRNISLFLEIIAIQICHLVLFLFVVRRFASLPATAYVTLAGFLAYCFFSPIQIENFIWGFQTAFVLTSLAATAAFAALLFRARRVANGEPKTGTRLLGLTVFCAFVAECSAAHGLVTWPVLLFLAFAFRLPGRDRLILLISATAAVAAYAIGYSSPDSPQPMGSALRQPLTAFHFVLTYFASSWDAHLPNTSAWPSVWESITAVAIVAVLVCSVRSLARRPALPPLHIALLGNLLFCLGTAVLTAFGRLQYGGLEGALAIRYQTPALVFWGSLVTLIAERLDWRPPHRLPIAQAALLLPMLAGGARWPMMALIAENRQYDQETAWNAAVQNRFDDPATARIYQRPELLKIFVPYLLRHRWGPRGEVPPFARLQPLTGSPTLQGYRVLPEPCIGNWDGAQRSGLTGLAVNGWVLPVLNRPAHRVAFASRAGKTIGYAEIVSVRPDVAALYPRAHNEPTGWAANLTLPGKGVYRAFLLFEDAGTACALPAELRIRNYPDF